VIVSENEPASITNLEAMSMGKALVINADNGTATYFRDKLGGYLVQSPDDLEGVMTDILHNRNLLREMGIRNQEDCRNLYDPKQVAQRIIGLLRGL
jgi:glycosyltransferase involved in cell wall biosynthesis